MLQRGDVLEIGGVELRVLHPPLPDWERRKVAMTIRWYSNCVSGAVSVLMTGDISKEVEQSLLSSLTPTARGAESPAPRQRDIEQRDLHRCPRTHRRNNRRGPRQHLRPPAPAVLDRYRQAATAIFRTDQDGQIDVVTDGQEVEVRTFTGRREEFNYEEDE